MSMVNEREGPGIRQTVGTGLDTLTWPDLSFIPRRLIINDEYGNEFDWKPWPACEAITLGDRGKYSWNVVTISYYIFCFSISGSYSHRHIRVTNQNIGHPTFNIARLHNTNGSNSGPCFDPVGRLMQRAPQIWAFQISGCGRCSGVGSCDLEWVHHCWC